LGEIGLRGRDDGFVSADAGGGVVGIGVVVAPPGDEAIVVVDCSIVGSTGADGRAVEDGGLDVVFESVAVERDALALPAAIRMTARTATGRARRRVRTASWVMIG
jgi:hypothetical protein